MLLKNKFTDVQMQMELQTIIVMLVKARAGLDVRDAEGYYPLHLAVLEYLKSRDPGLLLFLFGCRVDVNVRGPNGDTPLHLLLRADDVDWNMVQQFLYAGADLDQVNDAGDSPQDIINAINAQAEGSDFDTEDTDIEEAANQEGMEQGTLLTVRPREVVFTQAEVQLEQPPFQVRCLSLGALM